MNTKEIILFDDKRNADQLLEKQSIVELAINGKRMLFTKHAEAYYLFEKHCPHFDYPLKESPVSRSGEIVCPWHNYRFSLPNGGRESELRCKALHVIPARVTDAMQIVVNF